MSARLTAEQWSNYWRAGTVTTFMGRFGDNYDGIVLDFWRAVFERLPGNATIVDLGTGNGALAILAARYSEAKARQFTITGVDAADISPVETLSASGYSETLKDIRFLPGTRLEDTGLPKGEFKLACSQFGFEYADLQAATDEVARLLNTEGIFAAMMHAENSAIVRQALEGVRQVVKYRKSNMAPKVEALLRALAAATERGEDPVDDTACRALREELNGITGELHDAQNHFEDPGQLAYFLSETMSVFRNDAAQGANLEENIGRVRELAAEAELYRMRMRDMISSALSPDDIQYLHEYLSAHGLKTTFSSMVEFEGKKFCHAIVAARG